MYIVECMQFNKNQKIHIEFITCLDEYNQKMMVHKMYRRIEEYGRYRNRDKADRNKKFRHLSEVTENEMLEDCSKYSKFPFH